MALFLPPVLSNLDTSKSNTTGETENPRLRSASLNSLASILPLLSLSNFSKMACNKPNLLVEQTHISIQAKRKKVCSWKLPSNSEDCRTLQ